MHTSVISCCVRSDESSRARSLGTGSEGSFDVASGPRLSRSPPQSRIRCRRRRRGSEVRSYEARSTHARNVSEGRRSTWPLSPGAQLRRSARGHVPRFSSRPPDPHRPGEHGRDVANDAGPFARRDGVTYLPAMRAKPGQTREYMMKVKASTREKAMLAALSDLTGFPTSDIVRQAIRQLYRESFDEEGNPRQGAPRLTPEYAWALSRSPRRKPLPAD
jgi:hypothetical protein